uniref:Uncharacterized protein n=1 Tax=Micrurus spixii TaxID=129469 RepID=A0A2D4ME31_9SAUR
MRARQLVFACRSTGNQNSSSPERMCVPASWSSHMHALPVSGAPTCRLGEPLFQFLARAPAPILALCVEKVSPHCLISFQTSDCPDDIQVTSVRHLIKLTTTYYFIR